MRAIFILIIIGAIPAIGAGMDEFLLAGTPGELLRSVRKDVSAESTKARCLAERDQNLFPESCMRWALENSTDFKSPKQWNQVWAGISSLCVKNRDKIRDSSKIERWLASQFLSSPCREGLAERKKDMEYSSKSTW